MSGLRERLEGLMGALVTAPDELPARLVLADLLIERDEPLGELMQLSATDAWSPRLLELLREHEARFCELVAPGALLAWVHRGLPEIAWYRGRDLLGIRAAPVPLLRQLCLSVREEASQALRHPLLRNVTALTLITDRSTSVLDAVNAPALTTLTVAHFAGAGLEPLLRSAPSLRRLRVFADRERDPTALLEALGAVRPRLTELHLDGFTLRAHQPWLFQVALACGVRRLHVSSGDRPTTAPDGVTLCDWFDEPGLTPTAVLAEDDAFELFELPEALLATARPSSRSVIVDLGVLGDFVATQRGLAVRSAAQRAPSFAHAKALFVEASPAALDERFVGPLLQDFGPCEPSATLLRHFATLAELLPEARAGELDANRVMLTQAGPRITSPWQSGYERVHLTVLASYSPEHLRGEPYTVRSSVFALGVLIFRTLTGQLPQRQTDSPLALARGTQRGEFRSLSAIVAAPKALEALIAHMLRVDPLTRPEPTTIAQTLRSLADEVPDRALPAPRPSTLPQYTLWPSFRPDQRT